MPYIFPIVFKTGFCFYILNKGKTIYFIVKQFKIPEKILGFGRNLFRHSYFPEYLYPQNITALVNFRNLNISGYRSIGAQITLNLTRTFYVVTQFGLFPTNLQSPIFRFMLI